mgnify:CR=1 FL=1
MGKILSPDQAVNISAQLRNQGKKVILVGGCFDILHIGHIALFEQAKKKGDVLFVLLESDENIKKNKGPNRPINTQSDRAKVLENLELVNYVIPLDEITDNHDYDKLVISIKPAIIATTKGDKARFHKDRQAKQIDAKVIDVTGPITNQSTTKLIEILKEI